VVLEETGLVISADNPHFNQLKLISIEKGEALDFIRYECDGHLSHVFDNLRFDGENLFLVGKDYEK
jgi:hypothetical protein